MTTKNSQDQLIDLAMKELTKVLQDLKQGKEPSMSETMQKLSAELETVSEKKKVMSDQEIQEWAARIANEVSNLDD